MGKNWRVVHVKLDSMIDIFFQAFETITFGYPVLLGLIYAALFLALGSVFYFATRKLTVIKQELALQQHEVHEQMIEAQEQIREVNLTLKQVKRNVPFKLFELINLSILKQVEKVLLIIVSFIVRGRSFIVRLFSLSLIKEAFKQVKKIEWYRF